MNGSTQPQSAVSRLRAMLSKEGEILACPGVYDGLTARCAIEAGFKCLYMTGAGTSISRLGLPDLGLINMTEMLANASMIASLDRTVPLIADADTGYGGPTMVARTVKNYISAGIAGLHLEDQVLMKRCGHLAGKELVSADEFYIRIRAAVMAREEERVTTGGDIVIIARTDALQSFGFDEALTRLKKSIELGADVAFLEGVTSKDEAKKAIGMLAPAPVLLNNVPGGVTPDMTVEEARQLGYRLMLYPGLTIIPAVRCFTAAVKELRETGAVKIEDPEAAKKDFHRAFVVCGLQNCVDFDTKAGGHSYGSAHNPLG